MKQQATGGYAETIATAIEAEKNPAFTNALVFNNFGILRLFHILFFCIGTLYFFCFITTDETAIPGATCLLILLGISLAGFLGTHLLYIKGADRWAMQLGRDKAIIYLPLLGYIGMVVVFALAVNNISSLLFFTLWYLLALFAFSLLIASNWILIVFYSAMGGLGAYALVRFCDRNQQLFLPALLFFVSLLAAILAFAFWLFITRKQQFLEYKSMEQIHITVSADTVKKRVLMNKLLHDLQEPVFAIQLLSQYILSTQKIEEKNKHSIKNIFRCSSDLLQMIDKAKVYYENSDNAL